LEVQVRCFAVMVACLVALPVPARSQAGVDDRFASLDSVIRLEMMRGDVPGAAVVVVHGTDVVFAQTYGVTSTETRQPVTPRTLFPLASVTKMFTAVTVLSLVKEGLLDLNVPIRQYLPDLPPGIGSKSLHQLLTHTSGLRDVGGRWGIVDDAELPRFCGSLDDVNVFHRVDGVWSYANAGYSLAGCAAAAARGLPFSEVVTEQVLGPIGMTRSTFDPLTAMTRPLALGHEPGAELVDRYISLPYAAPAGMLISPLEEVALFATALANGGRVSGRQVIPQSVISALLETSVPATDFGWGSAEYGYGMFSWTWQGQRFVGHQGLLTGFSADLVANPEQRFAMVVLTNRTSAYLDGAKLEAIKLLLNLTPDELPTLDLGVPADENLDAWAGSYGMGQSGYDITVRDGRLWIKRGAQEDALERVSPDTYRVANPAGHRPFPSSGTPRVNFFTLIGVRGGDGAVNAIQYIWRVYPRRGTGSRE
jgi:CubicO group peptidase (beta-lactamase class C family)